MKTILVSPAKQFLQAALSASRNSRLVMDRATELAITGHMRFDVGDVIWLGRNHDWYDGRQLSFYAEAVKCGNDSFAKAFEADREMPPWLWPSCLVGWSRDEKKSEPLSRLYVGAAAWLVVKGKAALWTVTSISADQIRFARTSEETFRECDKCRRNIGTDQRSKVLGRVTFNRAAWGEHLTRLAAIRKLGFLNDGGLVVWSAVPHAGRTSADEQAWDCEIVGGWHKAERQQARVVSGVVLKSRGVLVHGETLRQARGIRKRKLAEWESQVQDWLSDGFRYGYRFTRDETSSNQDLDAPHRVADLLDAAKYDYEMTKGAKLRGRLRGETITIRQWLAGSENVQRDAERIGRLLRGQQQALSRAEYEQREAARREAEAQILRDHAETPVRISDSLDIGNCALGTWSWLCEHFPEVLPRGLTEQSDRLHGRADAEVVASKLRKIKRTLTVGAILAKCGTKVDTFLRGTLMHAIQRTSR